MYNNYFILHVTVCDQRDSFWQRLHSRRSTYVTRFSVRLFQLQAPTLCWSLSTQKVEESRAKGTRFYQRGGDAFYSLAHRFSCFSAECSGNFSTCWTLVRCTTCQVEVLPLGAAPLRSIRYRLTVFSVKHCPFSQAALLPWPAWIQGSGVWRGWHRGLASGCYRCFISLWSSVVKKKSSICPEGSPMRMWLQTGKTSSHDRQWLSCRWALETTWLVVCAGEEVKPVWSWTQSERDWRDGTETRSFTASQAMRAQTWGRSWQRLKRASWCSWTAGASRSSRMTLRRQETPCPTRSSTTTFPLGWWAWIFLIRFKG